MSPHGKALMLESRRTNRKGRIGVLFAYSVQASVIFVFFFITECTGRHDCYAVRPQI
jgi:hypothetical protein